MPKRKPGSEDGDEINQRFGSRIRRFREIAGLSQTDVGNALGVSFQQIQKYENGKTSISLSRMQDLARLFRISILNLMEEIQEPLSSRQLLGVNDNGQQPLIDDGEGPVARPHSNQKMALVDAFSRVKNARTRKTIVALIETLGDQAVLVDDEDTEEPRE